MKTIDLIARILLGLVFVVFGLNGFLKFIPIPAMTGPSAEFMGAMAATGYLGVIKVLEILGGALVLSGRMTKLGLIILGPIVVNILLFHIFMDKSGLPMAVVLSGLLLFLVSNRKMVSEALG